MNRNLDGIYFRVSRNGEFENVCFSDLTEDEMNQILRDREKEWIQSLCIMLGKKIKDIGDQLDIVCK